MLAGELVRQATGQSAAEYWDNGIANEIGITSEWWTDQSDQVLVIAALMQHQEICAIWPLRSTRTLARQTDTWRRLD